MMSIGVDVGPGCPRTRPRWGGCLWPGRGLRALDRWWKAGLQACTAKTITDPGGPAIRARGGAAATGTRGRAELEEGLLSAVGPGARPTGNVVAALASSTSVGRWTADRLRAEVVPLLVETAQALSDELGYVGPPLAAAHDGSR